MKNAEPKKCLKLLFYWFKPCDAIVEACPEQPFGALQFFPPKLT